MSLLAVAAVHRAAPQHDVVLHLENFHKGYWVNILYLIPYNVYGTKSSQVTAPGKP